MKNHFVPYNPKLKDRAREMRNNMTVGEKALWQRLQKKRMMGYDFDRQKPMNQFIVDFYCKALALAIEVDGWDCIEFCVSGLKSYYLRKPHYGSQAKGTESR